MSTWRNRPTYDPEPLLQAAGAPHRTDREIAGMLGVQLGTIQAWRNGSRHIYDVANRPDRYAVAAGRHPAEIWPEWLNHADLAAPQCGSPGCDRAARANQLCPKHLKQHQRTTR